MSGKIVVTGAGGFIGRQALPLLLKGGYDIHAVRSGNTACPALPRVRWHVLDLLARGAASSLLRKIRPEYMLHFAWETRPGIYWTSDTNLAWARASIELFEVFYRCGGRRGISAGTCAEYAWDGKGPLSENGTPAVPATLYGAAKLGFARMIDRYASQKGRSFAWGRVFFTFGPGEQPGRLVPGVIKALLEGKPVETGGRRHIRDFLYVKDVARAFVSLLESSVTGPVNIASGEGISIAAMEKEIGRVMGKPVRHKAGARKTGAAGEPEQLVADSSRLRREVGFAPAYSFARALKNTADWWCGRDHAAKGRR